MNAVHQKLPSGGPEREALRQKGQFWTPDWVAEAMVAYAVAAGSTQVFDPAVGAGAFFRAAKLLAEQTDASYKLLGCEIDPGALAKARAAGLSDDDLAGVQITDFVLQPPTGTFSSIVANPPYIRHHRLGAEVKIELKKLATRLIRKTLDGRAGLHVYFFLRALDLLDVNGRLAFIMPADTCEGVFAPTLWDWISRNYRLDAVITFSPAASPFPGVDTNPVIFMIQRACPKEHFLWAKCVHPDNWQLKSWVRSEFTAYCPGLRIHERRTDEGVATGLSRSPVSSGDSSLRPTLGEFAKVLRGIATGANDYFFLTAGQATELGIPAQFLRPAVGRTRDVIGDEITPQTIKQLEALGRPTLLFCVGDQPVESLPSPVQHYIRHGEGAGLPTRALIATRRPWYRMETRRVPPILFAYLGRRNARFLRNLAGVVPLTGFLCVYPHTDDPEFVGELWQVLRHPEIIANLSLVGKSYGSGAVKVEPRALERLPLPESVVSASRLSTYRTPDQMAFAMERRATYSALP